MKHALAAILMVVLIFVALGRLGDDGDADGRPTIEFWCYGEGSDNPTGKFWNEIVRRFEQENPGSRVRVVCDIPHGAYHSILTTRFVAGKPPDVFIHDDGAIGGMANENVLMPLDAFIESDPTYNSGDFALSMVRDSYIGDERFSLPWYGGFTCIYYRTDMFAQAGVRPPRTWDELLEVCKTLQEKQGLEYPLAMRISPGGSFFMLTWIWQNGGEILSEDQRTVVIHESEAVGAMQFVHDLVHKHRVVDPTLVKGTKPEDLWSTGKAAMIISGGWLIARWDELYPSTAGKWKVAPLPGRKKQVSFYGGQHLMMSRGTRHPELAWKFMSFATRIESQLLWTEQSGSPPSNRKTARIAEFHERFPHFAILPHIMQTGRNLPLVPYFGKIWWTHFANIIVDTALKQPDVDMAKAMSEARDVMQKSVDEFWETHDAETYRHQGRSRE